MKTKKRAVIYSFFIMLVMLPCMLFFSACSTSHGKSAYELAVEQGFEGSLSDWLDSLKEQPKETKPNKIDVNVNVTSENSYDIYKKACELGEYDGKYIDFVKDVLKLNENDSSIIANNCLSSVVTVQAKSSAVSYSNGSGVIYSIDENYNAFIITNYHVVYNSSNTSGVHKEFILNMYGNDNTKSFQATYVGGSKLYDIAILYVENSKTLKDCNAEAVTINTSDVLAGSSCFAIGNANGGGLSITNGCISLSSEYKNIESGGLTAEHRVIRHNAYITNGSSGGGLFNTNGELVGITNGGLRATSGDSNLIKFAIPSSVVFGVANNIIANCFGTTTTKIVSYNFGFTFESTESTIQNGDIVETIETISLSSINTSILNNINLSVGDTLLSAKLISNDKEISKSITKLYHLEEFLLLASTFQTLQLKVSRTGELENIVININISDLEKISKA